MPQKTPSRHESSSSRDKDTPVKVLPTPTQNNLKDKTTDTKESTSKSSSSESSTSWFASWFSSEKPKPKSDTPVVNRNEKYHNKKELLLISVVEIC